MSETNKWLERGKKSLASTYSRYFDVVASRGEGSWLIDVDGNRYLDLACGIAVTSLGHAHPKIVEAAQKQVAEVMHTSVVTIHQPLVQLAEKLGSVVPYMEEPRVWFSNSGAEVIDGAVKLARKVTHKPGVIAFRGSFHGRTIAATSLTTSNGKYRSGYEPLMSGVYFAPYCDEKSDVKEALRSLDEILTVLAPDPNIGMMLVEPVLGEGGYIPANKEWLQSLRDICNEHGILLVFDEIQTGIGRTGTMFAAEGYGVVPDVILFAKGIANGLPLSGLIVPARLMEQWPQGSHGTTFGGNPVSCAAALATLEVIESENLMPRVIAKGAEFVNEIAALDSPIVTDVRGRGFMIGVEFPDGETAARVQKHCFDKGVLILTCGTHSQVLRVIPPLNISDEDFRFGLDVLKSALI